MAIFTKDGKVYVVDGPNPLVEKQVSWEPSKIVLHNFGWDEVRAHNKRAETEPISEPHNNQTSQVDYQIQAIEQPEEKPESADAKERKEFDLPYIKYKVLCHCLPAKVQEKRDDLYGESWMRISYGSKFVFPCVVISSTDLSFEFWTSDPRNQISEKSVIYPFSYEVHNKDTDAHDRVPYDDYRWWKVSSKEAKEGGWLFTSVPSEHQPDFSD